MQLKTYSFLDTNCSLVGPGAAITLGSGSGASKEGITITPNVNANTMTIGADGAGMHNMHADESATIAVRLLKTSPQNALLAAAYAFQKASSANWGQNTISLTSTNLGDSITCQQVAFQKKPTLTWAEDGNYNEWLFDAVQVDYGLGA